MMGSRSRALQYATLSVQENHCSEPEEYDLDTYTLPVDAVAFSYGAAKTYQGARISQQSNYSRCNGVKKPYSEVNGDGISSELKLKLGVPSKSNLAGGKKSLLSPKLRRNTTLEQQPDEGKKHPKNPTKHCIRIFHDDPVVCSCCACHVLAKKGVERPNQAHQPRSRFAGATMGDMDGSMGVGNGRSGRRGGHHQPTFLKTVSIIDTLSELGPEVRQLAEEPAPPTPPPKVPAGSRTSASMPPAVTTASAAESICQEFLRPPGPPLVSPDFQQYTEKVYDAVTRRSEPFASTHVKNHRSRVSHSKVERPKRALNAGKSLDTNFSVRVEDKSLIRRPRHGDLRTRERGRTPDWIKRIFEISKKGDLESVKQSIADMEGTLVRNLSDHAGNNLLHVMAVFGHLSSMAWILTAHSVLVDALQDENKFGLTPLVCSIKYGRLHLVQWLVEYTCIKDKVKCKDGERSLLHIAAKYAQEEIVGWLVDYMMTHEIPLDNKDHHGNTALHLVARTGNARVCTILLQHGADVTLKNDLGQKAWEVCVIRGHLACAEYLCVHESGLALATDLTRREAELEAAMADNQDLRINFKELMNVARRLLREREEAVRELSKLHEQMVEAHDNIMALHVFSGDSQSLKEYNNGVCQSQQQQREHFESVVAYVTNLHENWQSVQKSWFGSSLVNMKHKMLLVEEAWKKLRHKNHRTVATAHHPLDIFRGKLCAIRAQGGEGRLGDLPSLCSSEESLGSLYPFSDNDDEVEDNTYEPLPSTSTPARDSKVGGEVIGKGTPRMDDEALYSTSKISELESISKSPMDVSIPATPKFDDSHSRPYWTDPSLSASLSLITDLSSADRLPRGELSSRFKDMALTSESGSCSVLEVIEPSSEESDAHGEEAASTERILADVSGEAKFRGFLERRSKRVPRSRHEENDISTLGELTTSSESGADCVPPLELLHSTDISAHLSPDAKHFLVNETSAGAAVTDVSDKGQRPTDHLEGQEQAIGVFKRKGFLHKLIKPSRWPSKRKGKNLRKLEPGGVPFELIDPYSPRTGGRPILSSIADIDPQTTPESNTSSSQEYSNSSEESSIGKPSSRPAASRQSYASVSHFDTESNSVGVRSNSISDIEKISEKPREILSFSQISHPSLSSVPPPLPSRRVMLPSVSSDNANTLHGYNSDRSLSLQRSENPLKAIISEVRSVATSEDSGIVARPSSSASKFESSSRPESSSSSFPPFKTDYSHQKSNLSLTQDMLPTPDSSTAGRLSPAPSEVSKTESALSPPSDVSKSESSRQTSMGKGSLASSTNSNYSKDGSVGSPDYSLSLLPLKKDMKVKTAAIINIPSDLKTQKPLNEGLSTEDLHNVRKERPWYELSDEESDILLPDRLTSKVVPRHSSSEDEAEIC